MARFKDKVITTKDSKQESARKEREAAEIKRRMAQAQNGKKTGTGKKK